MAYTPINITFDPPLIDDDPDVFDEKAFDTWGKANPWSDQINDIADETNQNAAAADQDRIDAQTARTGAETAQGLSEDARDAGEGFRDEAEGYKDTAETAAAAAQSAAGLPSLAGAANYKLTVNDTEDGVEWQELDTGVALYQEFTASGTFTKDPNASFIAFHVVAAGAGGTGENSGSGGQGFVMTFKADQVGSSETVVVGSSSAGGNGGNSAFGGYEAKGGETSTSSSGTFRWLFRHGFGDIDNLVTFFSVATRGSLEGYGHNNQPAGNSVYGGGGGTGQQTSQTGGNGQSTFAGKGGFKDEDGEFPGGGGGLSDTRTTVGGDGVVRVWQW